MNYIVYDKNGNVWHKASTLREAEQNLPEGGYIEDNIN
jgi:hypothetical protein